MRTNNEIIRKSAFNFNGVKPFPGDWPIRWIVSLKYREYSREPYKKFRYFGKPSKEVARKVQYILGRYPSGRAFLGEMDRAGIFRQSSGGFSTVGLGRRTSPTTPKGNFYFQWLPDVTLFNWILNPYWKKKMLIGKKPYVVFSNKERLTIPEIQEFKNWVQAGGVLNG